MTIAERIQNDIDTNRVVLYMKGIPEAPMCGFSKTVVDILRHLNVEFASVNVLEDLEIRQGIKEFPIGLPFRSCMWMVNLLVAVILP